MVGYSIEKGATKYSDNHVVATTDWVILGFQTGLIKTEWTQDRTHVNNNRTYKSNIDGSSSTFVKSDFEFHGHKYNIHPR